ncbi:MAG: rod shape-determining protein MreD [Parvibaculales bacterium]
MTIFSSYTRPAIYGRFSLTVMVVLLLLLDCAPTSDIIGINVAPMLFLIPIFYMAVFNERESTPIVILLLGLLKDLLSVTPLGFWGFLFSLFYALAYSQRQFIAGAGEYSDWGVFAALCFGIFLLAYLLGLSIDSLPPAGIAGFGSTIITALIYPIVVMVLKQIFGTDGRS